MPEKSRSLRALDSLNFCNAGIQTGLGPFIAIFYAAERHWNPGQIGLLLGISSLAGVLSQTFVGHAIDETPHKRPAAAAAAVIVTLGCIGIARFQSLAMQAVVQAIIGVAVTVFPAVTSAFALGMVDVKEVSSRIARNEAYTHSGNVAFAIIASVVGLLARVGDIFFAAAAFAFGMAVSAVTVRDEDVDYEAARAGELQGNEQKEHKENDAPKRSGWRDLLNDRRIRVFTLAVVLFNVANASTLPLVGQLLTQGRKQAPVWQTSACVLVAEAVMVMVAWFIGGRVDSWGRKPLFVSAYLILAVRAALTNVSHAQGYLIGLQALDGLAAGAYGVLLTVVSGDLARGTGRFNFLQGAVQSAMGLGAFLSNLLFGYLAHAAGFAASFWGLTAASILGGWLYFSQMPETRS